MNMAVFNDRFSRSHAHILMASRSEIHVGSKSWYSLGEFLRFPVTRAPLCSDLIPAKRALAIPLMRFHITGFVFT